MIHTFEAEFPKPAGSRLGIQLSLVDTPDREGLVVEKVAEGGAVDAYNKKSPEGYRIQEGDLVMKVNGVAADQGPLAHHMPAIAGKVMEASMMRLEVKRYCAGPGSLSGGAMKSPNLLPPPNFQDAPSWTGMGGSQQAAEDAGAMRQGWKGMQSMGLDQSSADAGACGQGPNQEADLLMQGQLPTRAMGMQLGGCSGGCGGGCGSGCGGNCGCGCGCGGCGCRGNSGCGNSGCCGLNSCCGGCGGCCGCGGCGCGGCGCCGNNPCGCSGCGCGGCGCGCGGGCGCGCGQYGGCGGCGLGDNSISGIQSGLAQLQQQLQLQQQQLQQQVMQSQANVLMPPPPPPLPPAAPQMRTPQQMPMNINVLSKQALQLQQKIAELQQQLGLMGFSEGAQVQQMMGVEDEAEGMQGGSAAGQASGRTPQPDANPGWSHAQLRGLTSVDREEEISQQSLMRNVQSMTHQQQPHAQKPKDEVPNQLDQNSSFTFEVFLQRAEGMRLGLSVLPVTMHDTAALWVNDVSEGGAVDAWNKSVCPAFQVRSGDAITRVFDAHGDHAKMMEELQSRRNIRLAVLRQAGTGPSPPVAKSTPKAPQHPPKALPAPRAQAQAQAEEAQNRQLMSGFPTALNSKQDEDLDTQPKTAGPPGLVVPLSREAAAPDDAGDLVGSIDIQESGSNGPLRFKVVLARKGPGRLGIDVVLKRETNFCGLLVYTVSEGGRVDAWNKQSQMPYRVLPGDHILEVNDVSISGDSNAQNDKFVVRMIQELSKDQKNVHFTVERVQLGQEAAPPEEDLEGAEPGALPGETRLRREEQSMPRQVGPQKALELQDAEVAGLPGETRLRREEQSIPRQVGPQKALELQDAEVAGSKAASKAPKSPVPWQQKPPSQPPGKEDPSVPDCEEPPSPLPEGTPEAKEEPEAAEVEEKNEDSKDKDAKESKEKEAKEEEKEPKEKEKAEKEPKAKEKPKAKPEAKVPVGSPQRPLPPPPKTVAPSKPGEMKPEKEKEPKSLSVPAPPAGPAPPPPEASMSSPKAKGQ
ncbi:unnamed protein product [Effrenium voratum]|uniref:PDZ domain-containing protein n=1 Tax=Effrenium voratum TaxID=2562239 RepID=A0AA36HUK0_9DINO|nr:unnamed protein product [Effrenium voratum]